MNLGPSSPCVVIAGMGPGGLAAAIGSARKGYQVTIIEPRTEAIRGQRVNIDGQTFQFLKSLQAPGNTDDNIFFNKKINYHPEITVQLKDIQRYLSRKLANFPNIQVCQGPQYKIMGFQEEPQQLTLMHEGVLKNIPFDHFVAADGARREMLGLLNQILPDEKKIKVERVPYQPRQAESGTISLQVKPGKSLGTRPENTAKFNMADIDRLKRYGWDQPYFPAVYFFSNQSNTKIFVSGEIPTDILSLSDKNLQKERLIAWGKLMAQMQLGYDPDHLTVIEKMSRTNPELAEAKNNLKATAFLLDLSHVDKSAIQLKQGGSFVLVGDANKNANFFFSHGVNDAISDARKFAEFLMPHQGFNFELYKRYQDKQYDMYLRRLKMVNDPSDMPTIKRDIRITAIALCTLAKTLANPQLKEQSLTLLSAIQNERAFADAQSYYQQLKNLVAQIEAVLEYKRQHAGLLRMIFSHHAIAAKQEKLDGLKTQLEQHFRKYFTLSPHQNSSKNTCTYTPSLNRSISGHWLRRQSSSRTSFTPRSPRCQ